MKKLLTLSFFVATLFYVIAVAQLPQVSASTLADGTYLVEYEMLQADNDSVSIANDYFEKPAKLTIDDGGHYVQFTVNRSEWVKSLQASNGDSFDDVEVISEDLENNQRVIAFKVDGDISEPVIMQMHVVIEEMEPAYDHKYSVRLDFDTESMQETDAPAVVVQSTDEKSTANPAEQEDSTSNKALIYVLIAVIVAAIVIIVRKMYSSKK
ncbi:NEAT domain-containing protein [Sporosarcina sp. NPDC096371]|uniref:NEAT domain-containing protein n=1 Tax=Sporosarcina sp. NPDC096371 TaxID=3364530 RepID=UPI0038307997